MAFLVTGAAGFIGSHSVDFLLKNGFSVIGIDNLRTGNLENLHSAQSKKGFFFQRIDITNEQELRGLFEQYKFDGVLHLAALVSVAESFVKADLNAGINLYGTDLLMRLCVEYGCRRFVFASSAAVYGDSGSLPHRECDEPHPCSPYAGAKLASEAMLLSYATSFGVEAVCFRYFNVYGPRQNPHSPYSGVLSIFLECFRSNRPITVYGDGEQTRDFISVQDIKFANVYALTSSNVVSGRYNLCTGRVTSLNQVLEIFREGYPKHSIIQYKGPRVGDIRYSQGDARWTKEKLGIVANVSLEEGLQKMMAANPQQIQKN